MSEPAIKRFRAPRRRRLRIAWLVWMLAIVVVAGCDSEDINALPEAKGIAAPCAGQLASFLDATGSTPMSAACDGNYFYTVSGGGNAGLRFGRYLPDGTNDLTAAPGIDFRAITVDRFGSLFAKGFGATGTVFAMTADGIPTPLYDLNDPNVQAKVALNFDNSEWLVRDGATVRRYSVADGSLIGSIGLIGVTPAELTGPYDVQLATGPGNRLYTYEGGNVSEWDLFGNRIAMFPAPIASPLDFESGWSFSRANNGLFYLWEFGTNQWVGFAGP